MGRKKSKWAESRKQRAKTAQVRARGLLQAMVRQFAARAIYSLSALRSVLRSLSVGQSWALLAWAVDISMLAGPNEIPGVRVITMNAYEK